MKVLVAVKRVVDHNVQIRVKPDGSDVELTHVKMAMNPFCEIAVEEAVRLKEQGTASEIVAVTIGPRAAQEQLRSAIALGADRAIHVQTEERVDSHCAARVLAQVAEQEQPGLVLLGKQSIDSDNNQTGQMLAALMGAAQGTFASNIEIDGQAATVTREVDGGLQRLRLSLPAVITADLRLNEPRYAKLPAIMKAKKTPLEDTTPEALGVSTASNIELLGVEPPQERRGGVKVASVDELVDKLRNEAKVIS
ncbi:electron transfer flavoprotein subunit beta/FixA family protein [Halomonas piscis]|uniref:Electron transfer flavoprotein subunit beta n=1 Tax=Halomonas piscis TaxID=3031727 RepID=A0ABY9Z379_9GAMM|nr:electron transfer flavoprotein subunit beta/FixA family protein [Halomonas piscis]WNK21472.1 electron transfer flavoprotein subunit beta/FixA family protein [Halomonas piscis]